MSRPPVNTLWLGGKSNCYLSSGSSAQLSTDDECTVLPPPLSRPHLSATMVSGFIVAVTKEWEGIHGLWEKMKEEEVDRNFKARMEEMEFALFETLAELYIHFLLINTLVPQLGSSCTGSSGRPHTQRLLRGPKVQSRQNWGWTVQLRRQGLRMLGQEVRQS